MINSHSGISYHEGQADMGHDTNLKATWLHHHNMIHCLQTSTQLRQIHIEQITKPLRDTQHKQPIAHNQKHRPNIYQILMICTPHWPTTTHVHNIKNALAIGVIKSQNTNKPAHLHNIKKCITNRSH